MKKFGCISPSVVQLPWDLHAILPADAVAAVVTLNVRNGRPGELERALSILRGATDVLIDEGARAIVVFGVPVSASRGFAAERDALRELTADRGAVPIVSSLAASVFGLQELGVRRPLLVTQYADNVNATIATFYRDAGLEVAATVGLGARNAAEVNALGATDFYELARRALADHPEADGVFLSARGNLGEVARRLESEADRPVVEQIQAAGWWAFRELGVAAPAGHGRLLSTPSTPTHSVA